MATTGRNPMTKTFRAKKIAELRQRIRKAARPPEECTEGWSNSIVDPMMVLAVCKPLHIKKGFVLRAYQYREDGNGNGFVWAMPLDAEFPEPQECPRLQGVFLEPPKPPAALDDFMDAIDGDGSPWSYMCASILACELAEFGVMWDGYDWDTHTVLGANPWNTVKGKEESDTGRPMGPVSEWTWMERPPRGWSPRVSEGEYGTVVTFFTFSRLEQEAIYRHTDTYKPGSFRFETERKQIATGPGGYVF